MNRILIPLRHAATRKRRVSALTVAASTATLVLAGGAYGYWSSTASGAADVKAATALPLGVSSSSTIVTDLFPGKTSDLSFVLSNRNGYAVSLTKLTAVSATSSDQAGCPAGTYLTFPSAVTTGIAGGGYVLPSAINVPSGSTSTSATLAGLVTMTTSAPDACQGKTFTVSLSFSGSQV